MNLAINWVKGITKIFDTVASTRRELFRRCCTVQYALKPADKLAKVATLSVFCGTGNRNLLDSKSSTPHRRLKVVERRAYTA
jgi:hypothetical protein